MAKLDFSSFDFIVFPRDGEDLQNFVSEGDKLIRDALKPLGWIGWVSPCHQPTGFENEGKPHYHVMMQTDTRDTSLKSVRSKLSAADLNIAGDYLVPVRDWASDLLYLTHSTQRAIAEDKEQFPVGTVPTPINQPASAYASQVCDCAYQSDVQRLIFEHCITSVKSLCNCVSQRMPQYYSRVWRDLGKWSLFVLPEPKEESSCVYDEE